jgi:hypothetical protein
MKFLENKNMGIKIFKISCFTVSRVLSFEATKTLMTEPLLSSLLKK